MGDGGDVRVRGQNGRRIQTTAVQPGGWTAAKRKLFLDTLAATCNVTTAARTAGMEAHSAYAMRRREPGFSDRWEEALKIGYQRLEEELLQRALGALEDVAIDPDASPAPGLPTLAEAAARAPAEATGSGRGHKVVGAGAGRGLPMEYQLALALLARREAAQARGPFATGRGRMTSDEVNELLAKKLDALARDEAQAAARRERAAAAAAAAAAGQGAGVDDGDGGPADAAPAPDDADAGGGRA